MNDSAAFKVGEMIGALAVLALFVGGGIFFIIALIKAISTRRTGWIVAACISSLPVLFIVVCLGIGFVVGFKRGLEQSNEATAASHGDSSQLLTADMTPVTGNVMAYQISLPWATSWQKDDAQQPFDYLFSYHDAYIGVIPEAIGSQTPQNICDISQKNLTSRATQSSFSDPQPIEIDSHSWLTYDATATVNQIKVKYRFYVYADTNYTFQIVAWTGPALFDRNAPVFDRIAKSFKMPQ